MFESDSSSSKNSVQAKIEKMFCEVAKDSGKNDILCKLLTMFSFFACAISKYNNNFQKYYMINEFETLKQKCFLRNFCYIKLMTKKID